MFFLTDIELSHVYKDPKSKKIHGTFGLGWKYQGQTVNVNVEMDIRHGDQDYIKDCVPVMNIAYVINVLGEAIF